ncbi:ABC transporter substrate-binding protein [Streptomyces sp. Ru73]|uniref:ABC transporter substrate-binding protein n=1 Tax=Streptomyces sp. Ru73 TaxID=2080748 RepID=UPI000CDD0BB2|nr:ABC transporter substrate-binding protein [Streptomyces sp. Ru73]POX40507.1 ABC transporter substrate-binding protein [Streptomyces sp. Ru73]
MTDDVGRPRSAGGGRTAARGRRRVALLTAGALLPLPLLAGCGGDDEAPAAGAGSQDIGPAAAATLRDGGTVRWAVDELPGTFNAFQADAGESTDTVAGAVLPALFTLNADGVPQRNADYLKAAEVTAREPKQVVTYTLNPEARWSDGRRISAADFAAQWKALRGKNAAYWTARNAGYDRIEKVTAGKEPGQVKVVFARPYADWQSLFTPLYPKSVMGSPAAFNDGARTKLTPSAGPFRVQAKAGRKDTLTLVRNSKWWGGRARLKKIVLTELPVAKRAAALAKGRIDVADVDRGTAKEITTARGENQQAAVGDDAPRGAVSADALRHQAQARGTEAERTAEKKRRAEAAAAAARQAHLRDYTVHRALSPSFTQLALNGSTGPLTDERVRRAVARAIDRTALAKEVLGPLRLPAAPVGSHLLLAGQPGYRDNSGALGGQDTEAAQALLADAGWRMPQGGAEQKTDAQPGEHKEDRGRTDADAGGTDDENGQGRAHEDGRAPAGQPHGGPARPGADHRAAGGRPVTLSALTGAGSAGVQRAALLRQSAALYDAAARSARHRALGDTRSAAYAAYERASGRAADAWDEADVLTEAAQRQTTALAAGWDDTKPGAGRDVAGTGPAGPLSAAQAREAAAAAERNRLAAAADHADRERAQAARAAAAPADDRAVRAGMAAPGEDDGRGAGDKDGKAAEHGRHAPGRDGDAAAGPSAVFVKKNGRPLMLRFVLPDGPGTAQLRTVADRISGMLAKIGVRTTVQKVSDKSYFEDHIASGDYDLALYSWPGSAYPATDAKPIYAKPRPAADGSLTVEQNYTRVGTDRIDQLFDQASAELDPDAARELVAQADQRIWAAAGSIPLYRQPQLVATRADLANVGAFGFATPRYQDIGYKK